MKISLIGPGQASQFVGMGKDFYKQFDVAKELFQKASEISELDLAGLCFNGPEEQLTRTDHVQTCISLVSIISYEILKQETGIEPFSTAGHSLGEYPALYIAGVLDFEQVIKAVTFRGKVMHETADRNPGGMTAVIGMDPEKIKSITEEFESSGLFTLANINSPKQIILSGDKKVLEQAAEKLKNEGARRIVPLKVSGPFHSPMMQAAADQMRDFFSIMDFSTPKIPIYSNVTAQKYPQNCDEIKNILVQQITSSVLWTDEIKQMRDDGTEAFIELTPNKVLAGLIRQIDKSIKTISFESVETLKNIKSEIS